MSRFTHPDPLGRYLADGVRFQLHEPMEYAEGDVDSLEKIVVPEGFITDFASIPVPVQAFLPKSIGRRAAILHDYLYASQGDKGRYTRLESDKIFLEALKVLDVPTFKRYPLYLGVRLGGWVPWQKYLDKR